MERAMVGREYAGHLTDTDLGLLVAAAGRDTAPGPARAVGAAGGPGAAGAADSLRRDPEELLRLLEQPAAFRAVLGQGDDPARGWTVGASPFLVFAVLVHREAAELAGLRHVPERTGLRQRVPLFDAPALRDFLAAPGRKLFLAELLASFTRVASGRYRVRAGGRTWTRRFSELDPVRLIGMVDAVPPAERPGVYRRLGDVSLFLTGVFPDYAANQALGPVNAARLLRAARLPAGQQQRLAAVPAIELLEYLGARWYRAARDLAPVTTARITVAADVADRFRQARRVLNHLADRYLLAPGQPWLDQPGG